MDDFLIWNVFLSLLCTLLAFRLTIRLKNFALSECKKACTFIVITIYRFWPEKRRKQNLCSINFQQKNILWKTNKLLTFSQSVKWKVQTDLYTLFRLKHILVTFIFILKLQLVSFIEVDNSNLSLKNISEISSFDTLKMYYVW